MRRQAFRGNCQHVSCSCGATKSRCSRRACRVTGRRVESIGSAAPHRAQPLVDSAMPHNPRCAHPCNRGAWRMHSTAFGRQQLARTLPCAPWTQESCCSALVHLYTGTVCRLTRDTVSPACCASAKARSCVFLNTVCSVVRTAEATFCRERSERATPYT